MKILMITQRIDLDDFILGFTHVWATKLAEKIDELSILALGIGRRELPENVKLYSMGREKGVGKLRKILNFYKYLIKALFRDKVDGIFVHMCPEYVILSVPLAKIKSIPIVFWYCHGSISYKLKIAEKVVSKIVTSTPEGCRLNSNKIQIIGHGIDTDFFSIKHSWGGKNSRIVLLSVGRISPIKDYETIIESIKILKNQKELRDYLLEVKIVGGLGTEHNKHYLKELNRKISDYDLESSINFVGPVPFDEVSSYFKECDIFLSASLTGSLDKAVLEAMACEKPVLTCNEAFFDVLKDFRKLLIFEKKNGQELANKIKTLLLMSDAERKNIGQELRNIVVANHSINNLVGNIISVFNNLF